jgi:uncharacterized protein YeeX (DUF496 family)
MASTKQKKPYRKFANRKAKIKQYETDVKMSIREWVHEVLLDGGVEPKLAKKLSFEASRYEVSGIKETAKQVISESLVHQIPKGKRDASNKMVTA